MSPALRELEAMLLNGRLRHGGHPVLGMCAANATVQMDPAGNRKLSKIEVARPDRRHGGAGDGGERGRHLGGDAGARRAVDDRLREKPRRRRHRSRPRRSRGLAISGTAVRTACSATTRPVPRQSGSWWREWGVQNCATNVRQFWCGGRDGCASSATSGSRTARQGASGLGIEAQRQAIDGFVAQQRSATLIARFTEVESGRNPDRPELARRCTSPRSPGRRW